MTLINHHNAFREELQEDRIRDIVYTMRIEQFFSFIRLILGIPALIVAITLGVASKDYGDDKM